MDGGKRELLIPLEKKKSKSTVVSRCGSTTTHMCPEHLETQSTLQ